MTIDRPSTVTGTVRTAKQFSTALPSSHLLSREQSTLQGFRREDGSFQSTKTEIMIGFRSWLPLGMALLVAVALDQCIVARSFTAQNLGAHQSFKFAMKPRSASRIPGGKTLKINMSADNEDKQVAENNLPFYLDPGTKGGAMFLSLVAFTVPILFYQFVTNVFHVDGIEAGKWIGGGFTVVATLAWVGTYIFRVATKDMTYVSTYSY